jgi:fatty acid desaturase
MTTFKSVAESDWDGGMSVSQVAPGSLGKRDVDYNKAFQELARHVKSVGLTAPRPRFYAVWMLANTGLLAAGWVAFGWLGDSWWVLLVATYLAFFYGQTGLIAHDIGHQQVFRNRKAVDITGYLFGNMLIGVSKGWWVNHHNRHHSNPNHLELDPDIRRRQVIFSPSQLPTRRGAINRFIIRHQSWLFFVIILLEGLRMHLAGYFAVALGAIKRNRVIDAGLLTVHLLTYFGVVFYLLSPLKAIAFVLVHQLLFGLYMGLLFAPNHKGMPVRGDQSKPLDWARRQIITSRNLVSNRVIDYVYYGVNYQIEHHLFPSVPSINLRRIRPIVIDFCRQYELPYVEMSLTASYREVSRFLGEVSEQSRPLIATRADREQNGLA